MSAFSIDDIPDLLVKEYGEGNYDNYKVFIKNSSPFYMEGAMAAQIEAGGLIEDGMKGTELYGLMTSGMSLSTDANWDESVYTKFSGLAKQALSNVFGGSNSYFGSLINRTMGAGMMNDIATATVQQGADFLNDQLHFITDTMKGYGGSGTPSTFSITLHIIPDEGQSYSLITKALTEFSLPWVKWNQQFSYLYKPSDLLDWREGKLDANGNMVTQAIDTKDKKAEEAFDNDTQWIYPLDGKLIHVGIGDWFLATGLFCSSVNQSFCQYLGTDGRPLWLDAAMTFQSYRALSRDEFSKWFLK